MVAVDLLEHVQPPDREAALQELARVAGKRLCVACPTGREAHESDRRLAGYYGRLRQPVPGWLEEHLVHGFPDERDLESVLQRRGSVRLVGNEWVRAHELVARAEITPGVNSAALAVARLFERITAANGSGAAAARTMMRALRGWDRRPTYRTIAVLDVDRAP